MNHIFKTIVMGLLAIAAAVCLAGMVSAEEISTSPDAPVVAPPENLCPPACPEPQVPAPGDAPSTTVTEPAPPASDTSTTPGQ